VNPASDSELIHVATTRSGSPLGGKVHAGRRSLVRDWIVVLVLYVVGLGFFGVLGGLRSAADALQRWGEASSAVPDEPASS
jgi:predicted metalloprotease